MSQDKVKTRAKPGSEGMDSMGAVAKIFKNEMIRLGFILLVITAIAAMLLALVNEITKEPIAELQAQALKESMENVFSGADEFELLDVAVESPVTAVYEAKSGGKTAGYCVRVAPKGFGGEIDMVVGVSDEYTVKGVEIISMSETPGLGTRAMEEEFSSQYIGKGLSVKVVKSNSPKDDEITAISGATITSKAITEGINAALKAAQALGKGA